MPTRKKPTTSARAKTSTKKTKTTHRKTSSKKSINLGGSIGPLGWIVVIAIIGYVGWALSQNGAVTDADASIRDGKLATVRLSPTVGSTTTGGSLLLTADAFDASNKPIPSGVSYSWQAVSRGGTTGKITLNSGNPHQASLTAGDQSGVLGIIVTASTGRRTVYASGNIVVNPSPGISRVVIDPMVGHIPVGESKEFTARTLDINGREVSKDVRYQWTLRNSSGMTSTLQSRGSTAKVMAGMVEGITNLQVTATSKSKSVTTTIQVLVDNQSKPTKIVFAPLTGTMKSNNLLEMGAKVFDANNKEITSSPGITYKWTIMSGGDLIKFVGESYKKSKALFSSGNKKGLARIQLQASDMYGNTTSQVTYVVVQ